MVRGLVSQIDPQKELNETIGFFVAFSLLKKANNFFTNCWHSGDKSDFSPILQKMQNIAIIELGVLTKNVIVMLLIVLAEAAPR
jgi:hypothetical protein